MWQKLRFVEPVRGRHEYDADRGGIRYPRRGHDGCVYAGADYAGRGWGIHPQQAPEVALETMAKGLVQALP